MFNMPITFGVERSTILPPAFMLMHYHYAVGNDIDFDFRLGDFGDFFAVFACIFSKMLLLRYRNLPYLGLTFEYNGFAYAILGHEKAVIGEPYQNGVAFALPLNADETSFLFEYFHYLPFHFDGVGRLGAQLTCQFLYVDGTVFVDVFSVVFNWLCEGVSFLVQT